ncbi:hypothetical protein V1L52_03675 [Treponema sp. HNW]|uniref:hypothetical protein n=1 Tax=Treponema sp. HNW TaxID=3116654 RepID=UPI003D149E4D
MTVELHNSVQDGFTRVPLEEFFDEDEISRTEEASTNIIVLTSAEQDLVNSVFERLRTVSPETLVVLADRLADLEKLTVNIAHFPSLRQSQDHGTEVRNMHTLVDALLVRREGDRSLHLPSKAVLGRGFSVAKFHTFSAMEKIAAASDFPESILKRLRRCCLDLLFTIMAEDVYLNLLDNDTIGIDIRQDIAYELIMLWEHRSDETVIKMAPVLDAVWNARRGLTPAFGTMVGTSELLLLTMAMDDQWCHFISSRMGNEDAAMAMEEFLFGISWEEIQKVKKNISEKKVSAVDGKEAAHILGRPYDAFKPKTDEFEPRDFYLLYSVRRDNARARLRLSLPGPHYTLEDHYMRFILETNKERRFEEE